MLCMHASMKPKEKSPALHPHPGTCGYSALATGCSAPTTVQGNRLKGPVQAGWTIAVVLLLLDLLKGLNRRPCTALALGRSFTRFHSLTLYRVDDVDRATSLICEPFTGLNQRTLYRLTTNDLHGGLS